MEMVYKHNIYIMHVLCKSEFTNMATMRICGILTDKTVTRNL